MTLDSRRSRPPTQSRHRPSELRLLLAAACAAAVVSSSLVGLVLVRTAAVDAGYRVHDRRAALARLRDERAALELERAMLLRPTRLAAEAGRLGLGPVEPATVVAGGAP
ncbi:MAG: hypothetical protein HYS27_20170 [Deltaproteobacteria bacterium]|nr:hypothetical protein [Deltaproteobacteria bacterium]